MDIQEHTASETPGAMADPLAGFFPKGAIAFFLGVILTMATVWLTAYAIMISRAG